MKKISQNQFLSKFNTNKNLILDSKKTTNVNILLNRVRQDKKNDLRKKIFFSSSLIFGLTITALIVIF